MESRRTSTPFALLISRASTTSRPFITMGIPVSQHVARFDLEITAFDEVLRTNLNLHHRVRCPEREVHDLFDHVGLAFDRAFKYALGQHVIANDIANTISPVG